MSNVILKSCFGVRTVGEILIFRVFNKMLHYVTHVYYVLDFSCCLTVNLISFVWLQNLSSWSKKFYLKLFIWVNLFFEIGSCSPFLQLPSVMSYKILVMWNSQIFRVFITLNNKIVYFPGCFIFRGLIQV